MDELSEKLQGGGGLSFLIQKNCCRFLLLLTVGHKFPEKQ